MRFAFLATLAVLAPLSAQAQIQTSERLLFNAPQGWTTVPVQRSDKMIVSRMLPPGQNDKQWTESITLQMYPNAEFTPRGFVENAITHARTSCEAAGPGPVTETQVNAYPMALVTIACSKGKQTGMGSYVLIQAIRGKDALYVVQRQWRGTPFGKNQDPAIPGGTLKEWAEFSKSVGLCDTRDTRHPCP